MPIPQVVDSGRIQLPPGQLVLTPTGERVVALGFEENGQILVGRWIGYCTPENVALGAHAALRLLRHHPCPAMLSDGSTTLGDWSELLPWMQYDLLPRLVAVGIRYTANVRSPDAAARLAHVAYSHVANQHLRNEMFDEVEAARTWLLAQIASDTGRPAAFAQIARA